MDVLIDYATVCGIGSSARIADKVVKYLRDIFARAIKGTGFEYRCVLIAIKIVTTIITLFLIFYSVLYIIRILCIFLYIFIYIYLNIV